MPQSSLADSQAAFIAALRSPDLPAPADIARPGYPSGNGSPADTPPAERPAQTRRFDVYRNNVIVTAIDALAETFPAVQRLVGEEFFRAVARAFIDAAPPVSPILARIGAHFGDFLDDFPPSAALPYLGDVARLEQARIDAHHAADADPVPIQALAGFAAEHVGDVLLTPHPSLTLIRSRFPVGALWAASTDALDPSEVNMERAEDVLVIRPAMEVNTAILPEGSGAFLAAILDGMTIAEAAETTADRDGNFDLSHHLAGTFAAGAFIAAALPAGAEHTTMEKHHA